MGKDKAPKPVEDDGVDFGPAKKAGKGHRQRGAGTVITAKAPVVTGDGILLKAHERLPVQLLQEFCQREKRPKAVFHKEGPGRRMRVLLPDAKNNKNDLVFCPSATDFESDAVARDYAALLALFHFQKSLPLERKLPEPYSTTWKQMLTADKESSSNSSSNSKRTRETKAETSANSKASALVKEEVETDVNNTKVGIAGKDAPIPTAALATPVLDKATADWMCDACASQNYATLASGQPRTKCFRCQKQKSDSCVLVASTSNQATKQSSGAKAPPAPILNLTASNKYISKAEAVQAKLQRRAESKRKSTYFEAVRKANKPMTVYLSTKLRNLLEDALGLSSKSNKMSAVNSIEDVLAILPEKGLVFPQDVCYLNADMQSILLEDVFDDLHYKGFKKSDVYDAFVEIFENKISDISDSFEETIGSIDDATSNDNEFETKLKEAYKQQLQEALTAQLCISLDESDLPVSFRSSAENKLKFEVMKNPSRGNQAKADDQSVATVTDPTASTLEQYGWRYDACVAAVSALSTIASQTIDASETRLYQLLLLLNTALVASGCIANSNPEECVLSPCSIIDKLCDSNFQGLPLAVNSQLQEELETLEAIFGDRFSSNFPTETLCRITIDLNPERHCDDADKMIIFISSLDNYPTRMPLIVLPKHNLNTLVDIYRQLLEEWDSIKGEVMIFHICTRVEEYIHTAADVATLNSSTIYDKLIDTVNIIGSNWNSIIDGNTDSIISVVAEELDNLSLDQTTNATNDSSSVGTSSNKTVEKRFHPFWERNKRRRTVSSRPSPEMVAFRETLPAFATRAEFLSLISSHQTMVLTGETGCGKSTQVPQYLLESEPSAKIIICQPRRLAAIGVATRIAEEMNVSIGQEVGYMVKGDSKITSNTQIAFCTYGVLLRRLQDDPTLDAIDYIILDEVHERGIESDFSLALLTSCLRKRDNLKLILMSATISTEGFASYLQKQLQLVRVPPVHLIPGRIFPVEDYYKGDYENLLRDCDSTDRIGGQKRKGDLDYDLLVRLVLALATGSLSNTSKMMNTASGAILIFVPGVPEISRAIYLIQNALNSMNTSKQIKLLPLHGNLSAAEQRKVFPVARSNELKIVVATNVAEASITIPDVTIVIDSCRVKEMGYDTELQASALITKFAARDSLQQRKGRAGRVQKGRCFRLITEGTYNKLPPHGVPEMLRSPLDRLVLQVKAMKSAIIAKNKNNCDFNSSYELLRRCPDPPSEEAVVTAEEFLSQIHALDSTNGSLTPLGMHLASLPCPPQVGKLIIYGSLLGCVYHAACVGACIQTRSPFISTPDKEIQQQINDTKNKYMRTKAIRSDYSVVVNMLIEFTKQSNQRRFCKDNFLSYDRMLEIKQSQSDLLQSLTEIGFLTNKKDGLDLTSYNNRNFNNYRLVNACYSAGLYPQLAKIIRPPKRFVEVAGGAVEREKDAKELKFYIPDSNSTSAIKSVNGNSNGNSNNGGNSNNIDITVDGLQRVFLHPSSINFTNSNFSTSNFVLFGEKQLVVYPDSQPKLYLRDTTEVTVFALLLFGGRLETYFMDNIVTLDNWIRFSATGKTVALIQALRQAFDELLQQKINNPQQDLSSSPVLEVACRILQTDGL